MATMRAGGGLPRFLTTCLLVSLAHEVSPRCVAAVEDPPIEADSLAPAELERTLRLHDALVEDWFDEVEWAELDALLLDPVPLRPGGVMRLAALPWLSAAQLKSLAQAKGLRSWDDLARLRGWNAELARSVLPFVRFEQPRSSWAMGVRSRWAENRREARWNAEGAGWEGAFRVRPDAAGEKSGFASMEWAGMRVVAGDLRLGVSQGLLWWSSESDLRASSAPFRQARGLVGTDTGGGSRGIRGAGIELGSRGLQLQAVAGRALDRRLQGVVTTMSLPRGMRARVGWLRLQGRHSGGFSLGWAGASAQVEAEFRPVARGSALGLAMESRWRHLRLAARLQETPAQPGVSMAASGPSERRGAARHALLLMTGRRGAARFEWALHRRVHFDSSGSREESFEQRWGVRWSWPRRALELRLHERRATQEELGIEGPAAPQVALRRGFVVRTLHALHGRSEFGLEYRLQEWQQDGRHERGSSWQVHVQSRRGMLHGHLALTSFLAPSGNAAPVVADPGIGTLAAPRLLVGDGIRAACALRARLQQVEIAARCGRSFLRERRPFDWELSLRLRLR